MELTKLQDLMRLISVLFLFMILYCQSMAQTYTIKNKKAIEYYEYARKQYGLYDYNTAIEYVNKALNAKQEFYEAHFLLGEIYLERGETENAIRSYNEAIRINPDYQAMIYLALAEAQLKTGYYENAKNNLTKYIGFKYIEPSNSIRAKKYIKNCEFAIEALKKPVPFEPINLGDNINSTNSEYLPALTADEQTLIVTVRRPRDVYTETQSNEEEDFYISKKIKGEWSRAVPIGSPLNTHGNEGAQAISPDGRFFVFTGCNRRNGWGSCDLYISQKIGNEWTPPQNMGKRVNSSSWDSQPSISADGKTIYFASTRPGGKGKSDIWSTKLDTTGYWSVPINLGDSINTVDIEFSPFIHPDDKTLYFASDGHPGMGGMDIFMTRKDSNLQWRKPKNLGYPINTFNDESSLILNAKGDLAYFSSDKLNGYGGFDLFSFKLYEEARPEPVSFMKGIVFDSETKQKLKAKFELISLSDGKTIIESHSDSITGEFLICLPINNEYALNVSHDKYIFYSEHFTFPEEYRSKIDPFLKNIPLKPIKIGESFVLKNIFFDFDKFELLITSEIELNRLFRLLKKYNTLKIEIGGHTDSDGSEDYNQKLSENRAKAVYNYLVNSGISSKRLSYKGYGESMPIDNNDTEAGKANNRRTEFKIIEL